MVSSISSAGGLSSSYISQMQEKMLKAVDSNGDGSVSKDEFVSNRPKEVSEDQASEMWGRLDTGDSGSLTGSEFMSAMENQGPPPGQPPGEFEGQDESDETSSTTSGSGTTASNELVQALLEAIDKYTAATEESDSTSNQARGSLSDLFGKLDTDGDGSVSKEEYVSNRPDEVSEDQANEMWGRLDTSDSGSLTESEFMSAMESQGPPPGPPPGKFNGQDESGVSSSTASSSSATSSSSGTTTTDELVQAMLEAIKEYTSLTEPTDANLVAGSVAASLVSTVA
ncbi:MAG: EF-hand domain-containing protein [Pseudomonadota bacterium]